MPLLEKIFQFRQFQDEPKPFLDHLEDLRSMLIKMAIALGAAMMASFLGRQYLFAVIQRPLAEVDPARLENLQSLGVVDSFTISLQLAFYAGLVLSFPFLLYFLAEFVLPALTEHERKHIWPATFIGFALFLGGVSFAYFIVLPKALAFFYQDASSLGWVPTWTVREYYSFTTQFVIAFGLAFELPVVVLLLVKMEILDAPALRRLRLQALVAVMIFAAVLTPTTDMVTMLLMGAPMYLLYEACIIIASVMMRRPRPVAAGSVETLEDGGEGHENDRL